MIDRITELRAQYRNKVLKKYNLGASTDTTKEQEDRAKWFTDLFGEKEPDTEDLDVTKEAKPISKGDNISFWDKVTHPKTMLFNQIGAYSEDKQDKTDKSSPSQNPTKGAINTMPVNLTTAPNIMTEYTGLNGSDTVYKPGSEDEKLAQDQKNFQSQFETTNTDKGDKKQTEADRLAQLQLLFSTPAGDMSTNFYNFGRALGMKKGTKGRGLLAVGAGGAGILGAARQITSGIGYSKANAYTQKYMRDQMLQNQNQYTAASQTENTNYTGGQGFRNGGFFRYEDGGEQLMQMADDGNTGEVQEEQPQMTPQQQEQIMKIAEQLVSKLGSLEAIDAYLREQQVDQQTYEAIMTIAEQMLGQEEEQPETKESMEEQPEMKDGGNIFNKNVGDYIEFEYEGKKHSGKISKIENGQIYL